MRIIQFSAFGPVLCNLRNDFVCLIDHKFVADTQSQILIDGEVMHIGAAHHRPVNPHRLKSRCQTDHSSSGHGNIQSGTLRFIEFVLPFECHQPIFMMSGGAKTPAIDKVVVFHNHAVHGVAILSGLEICDQLTKLICIMGIRIHIRNYIKPIFRKELKLGSFALFFDRIADQIKSKKLQISFPRLTGIQHSYAAGCQISGVGIWLTQTEIDLFKVRPGNDAFTSHLKFVCTGNAHWHIHKSADGMRHILADNALTASGDCLLELSTFVAEDYRQAIQFPREHHRSAVCKPKHLINGLCFIR